MSKNPTGLCSAHQHGEDKNCKICYPANSSNRQVERVLDGMCSCEGLQKAIDDGVKSMISEGAPGFAIDDYIQEMQTGDWVKCSCNCNAI